MTREEAINLVKQVLPCLNIDEKIREGFETLIPELKESEDERMLREIKRYLKEQGDKPTGLPNGTVAVSDMIAWLEKNKEQKPAEWDEDTKTNLDRALQIIKKAKGTLQGYQSDDGIYECDKAIECLEHFLYRGLETEKSVEWSKNDTVFLNEITDFFENKTVRLQHELDMYAHWLKSLPERFILQPKQEWSDEDKKLIDDVINSLCCYQNTLSDYQKEIVGEEIRKLKLLKPQLKQEWSEEDEKCIKDIIDCLKYLEMKDTERQYNGDRIVNPRRYADMIAKLKSLRPQSKQEWSDEDKGLLLKCISALQNSGNWFLADKLSSLCPQPSWKPTEEQMRALDKAIPLCLGVVGRNEIAPLESLYEQLKKLQS